MRKLVITVLLGAAVLAPATAEAITLDPGERLMIVCQDRQPFVGSPFSRDGATETRKIRPHRPRRTRVFAFGTIEESPVIGPLFVRSAQVRVKRVGANTYRLQTAGAPVSWRGC